MRISDWSSDVCSSDLNSGFGAITLAAAIGFIAKLIYLEARSPNAPRRRRVSRSKSRPLRCTASGAAQGDDCRRDHLIVSGVAAGLSSILRDMRQRRVSIERGSAPSPQELVRGAGT